jgi:hypothetical protein
LDGRCGEAGAAAGDEEEDDDIGDVDGNSHPGFIVLSIAL